MTTYQFLKILPKVYAETFLSKGEVKFSQPIAWSKIEGDSRGDVYEGVYASTSSADPKVHEKLLSSRPEAEMLEIDGKYVFRSKSVMQMWAYCLYGVNDCDFEQNTFRSEDLRFYKNTNVPKEYFQKLSPSVSKEEFDTLPPDKKPKLLMINPDKFTDKLMRKLKEIGVRENEILFQPVTYRDLRNTDYFSEPSPLELFNKDVSYSEQHEIRCVVCSNRPEIQQYFQEQKGIIELGEMKDAAFAMDYFFKDMAMQARDKHLVFELSKPVFIEGNKDTTLIALSEILSDAYPWTFKSIEEMEREIKETSDMLRDKYSIIYNRNDHSVLMDGEKYDIGLQCLERMLYYYNCFYENGDQAEAQLTLNKILHFYPMYADLMECEKGTMIRELLKSPIHLRE